MTSSRKRRLLFHGTTIHGAQNSEPAKHLIPLSYYHRTGPAGQVLLAGARGGAASKVAIVGLGTGALACHGAAAQQFTFYEIDPMVEKIARDAAFVHLSARLSAEDRCHHRRRALVVGERAESLFRHFCFRCI